MQSERGRSSTDIFNEALERPSEERSAFLEQRCGGDPDLRRQVDLLLRYHDEAGDFLAAPAAANAPELLTTDPEALIGQRLGCYRIDGVLGIGGMGVVYLARDERLGRKVGLKLLPPALVRDETQLERLKFEARTASALNHPNIVTVHDIGQVDETHYIAIEFIEGVTLRERILRGPIPAEEAVEIMTQVASAFCVAHRAGIVHCDIKPENIMIRPDGYVKVLDFGIAKSAQENIAANATVTLSKSQTRTSFGVVIGTVRYMSPEQARGETVDARSDIWSIGVVLHEMLTGARPFDGRTVTDVKDAIVSSEPQALDAGTIPFPLQEIVARCLQKDPADRFQSSEDLLAELRKQAPHARRPAVRAKVLAALGGVVVIGALLLAFFGPRWRRDNAGTGPPLGETKPTGIAVDAKGIIYVADFPNHAILQIATDGRMTELAGVRGESGSRDAVGRAARFSGPADVALGPDNALYVPDCDNHVIRKVTLDGTVTTVAGQVQQGGHEDGPAASAKFKFPTGVAVDRAGNVYVADIGNHVVRKIANNGVVSTLAGVPGKPGTEDGPGIRARFNQPHGLDVDRDGNVYAADFGNHTVRKITPEGVVTTIAGEAGVPGSNDGAGTAAHLCAPYSVATDTGGNVYVADTSNHTIRKIGPDGVVSTVAGLAGNVGNRDARAELARFAIPAAVEVDSHGNIFVADFGNHAIRKIAPDATVATVSVRTNPTTESARKSIAVLPFADLSARHDQQYFSDGIAEEILNALAHVKDLKVAGRSSSFSFRDKNQDLRKIGTALGVAHILEGSVRTQGDKVRITAQLIQVSDGFHLWSETYDGDLRDVFSLQERIARAITGQLQVVLQGEQKSQLVKTATTSTEAYALYLQATAVFNRRDGARFRDAFAQLNKAVQLDPKFARAHAKLASLASIAPQYDVQLDEEASGIVTREARIATELDPTLAEPHAAVGQTLFTQRRFAEARAAYARALEVDPDDLIANFWLGTLLSSTGYAKASGSVLDKVLAKDPMFPNALLWRGWVHLQRGEIDQAERSIRRAADAGLTPVGLGFAHVALARGDKAALVDWLARGLEPFVTDLPSGTSRVIAAGTAGSAAEHAEAIAAIERYLATQPRVVSGAIPLALIWLGQPERALAIAQEKPTRNDTLLLPSLWTAAGHTARTLPQFASFARRTGLADFWDRSGAPDLCNKTDGSDYACSESAPPPIGANANAFTAHATGVAVAPDGTLYIADFSEHTILEITPEGLLREFAGSRGTTGFSDGTGAQAQFNHPAALAVDNAGNVYVADTNNHVVRKITPARQVTTLAGTAGQPGSNDGPAPSARFTFPTSVAVDDRRNVWVADFGNHTLRKITPEGVVSTVAGVAGESGSVDGAGPAARFNQIHGVALDATGNIYAADFGNHTIRKISPDGSVATLAGAAGNCGSNDGAGAAARFCAPYAAVVDNTGNVFVADTSNQTIRKIAPGGIVTTIAGSPGSAGSVDGPSAAARFAIPAGIAVDRNGNIYVADFGNYSVRKITPNGTVSTVAGITAKRDDPDAPRPLPPL